MTIRFRPAANQRPAIAPGMVAGRAEEYLCGVPASGVVVAEGQSQHCGLSTPWLSTVMIYGLIREILGGYDRFGLAWLPLAAIWWRPRWRARGLGSLTSDPGLGFPLGRRSYLILLDTVIHRSVVQFVVFGV